MSDDFLMGGTLLILSLMGTVVGLPIIKAGFPPKMVETVGYLEEGWDVTQPGKIAQVTGIEPAGETYEVDGRTFQECVISYTIIPYFGVVGRDDEGLPLLLWRGQQVYAVDVEESVREDRCDFHN
jgi:hypothetical protein